MSRRPWSLTTRSRAGSDDPRVPSEKNRREAEEEIAAPPDLRPPPPPPVSNQPLLLGLSEYDGIAELGNRDPEEWFTDVLTGKEPWPPVEQQAVLSKWWGKHVGYDAAVIAVWMAERGIGSTTTAAVVDTADLGPTLSSLHQGQVPRDLARASTGSALVAYQRDANGVLGPVVTDDKEIGTCVPLLAPRAASRPWPTWITGTSVVAAFLFGGLLGHLGNGTETTLVAAPPAVASPALASPAVTEPAEPARSAAQESTPQAVGFARLSVTFTRPVSTYTLDVDPPVLVSRYEWSVTGPEQATCYAPTQFGWSPDSPVAVWNHPHDPETHLPCAPGEDHARSIVTVRAYFGDGSGFTCRHQGAAPTTEPDPCFAIQP